MRHILVTFLFAVALLGCQKKTKSEPSEEPAAQARALPPGPDPITKTEADMGRQACQKYVDQVCACALKIPELSEQCDLDRSRPDALAMNLRAAMAEGDLTPTDRSVLVANTRKIMSACIEDASALVKRGCPLDGDGSTPGAPDPAAPDAKR